MEVIFGEQLPGYPPKGTQFFPFDNKETPIGSPFPLTSTSWKMLHGPTVDFGRISPGRKHQALHHCQETLLANLFWKSKFQKKHILLKLPDIFNIYRNNNNISNISITQFSHTWTTPRKINMEPENTPFVKENHLPNHHFQVLCESSGVQTCLILGVNVIPFEPRKKKRIPFHYTGCLIGILIMVDHNPYRTG